MIRSTRISAVLFCALLPAGCAYADTITFDGTIIVANGGAAPGSSTDYGFFGSSGTETGGAKGQPVPQFTNFSVDYNLSVPGNSKKHIPGVPEYQYGGNSSLGPGNPDYSTISAPGSTRVFSTGILYFTATGQNEILATFTNTTETSFTVYILDGNTDGFLVGNSSVGIGEAGGAEVSSAGAHAYDGVNQFSAFTVTAPLDTTFDVYAMGSTTNETGETAGQANQSSIGGLTFGPAIAPLGSDSSPSATPEPSSVLLLGTGLLSVCGMARRRFSKAA